MMDKEIRRYKEALISLKNNTVVCIFAFDAEMEKPPTLERNRRITIIADTLEKADEIVKKLDFGATHSKDRSLN